MAETNKKTGSDNVPTNLQELCNNVKCVAKSFGFEDEKNGIFRNRVLTNNEEVRRLKNNKKADEYNFWLGITREDQDGNGKYEGLSFVIFPEYPEIPEDKSSEQEVAPSEQEKVSHTRCLVAIGIGSSSIGKDGELAASPGFRRSFMRLTEKGKSNAEFFFKLRFDEMDTSTPGLQEYLEKKENNFDQVMINTATKYNADDDKDAPGLLPAAFIVDYTTDAGWNLIKAWLAQYAKWRCWDKTQKGKDKENFKNNIGGAINICKCEVKCPTRDEVKKILLDRNYVVLQGAPGCGKTWTANEVAELIKKDNNDNNNDNIIFTQFHAETTYSDFVYGIRPALNGQTVAYKGEKGVLLKAIEQAQNNPEKNVLLIIDEINRANLANVLGPVFYLFEPNGSRQYELELGTIYEKDQEKKLKYKDLPKNLYVLATMNTADKSLAVVDFALRRRFAWVTLRPHKLSENDFDGEFFDEVDELFVKYATDEELNLQPGQSYFIHKGNRNDIIKYELMPLMKEYFAEGFLLPAKEEFAQLFYSKSNDIMFE